MASRRPAPVEVEPKEKSRALDDYHAAHLRVTEALLLPKAREGDGWASRRLLEVCAAALRHGIVIRPAIADYLATAFEAIADLKDANEALGVKRKRGERDLRQQRESAYVAADDVERYRHYGMKLEAAIAETARAFRIPEDTVKGYWKKHGAECRRRMRLEFEALGRVARPHGPPAKRPGS